MTLLLAADRQQAGSYRDWGMPRFVEMVGPARLHAKERIVLC